MKKLELPTPNKFIPVDPTVLGEVCQVVAKGADCDDTYAVGDVIVVLGGQVYTVPQLDLEWVHNDAVLMTIQGYDNGR